jgi:LysM repeat protein
VIRRCSSCGSRVAPELTSCPICGHEFGTTQTIPRVRLQEEAPRPEPLAAPSTDFNSDNGTRGSALTKLPWGVIGVIGVILGIALGALVLLRSGVANQDEITPTVVILGDANLTAVAQAAANVETPTPTAPPTLAPTTPAPTLPPTQTPIPPVEYVVKRGDTCGGIAAQFKVPLEAFTALNQLDPVNCLIRIGEKVSIPAPTPTAAPTETLPPGVTPSPTGPAQPTATLPPQLVYVVKGGDTCGEIAQKFNVTVDLIIQQNNLDANCLIQLNQVLTLTFATPTPIASPTPFVLQTPTPRTGYSQPMLISPQDGAQISETQEAMTLQWLTVGLLKENEWYVVQVQPSGAITVPIWETKATSLKLTRDIIGDQPEAAIAWWVQVKQLLASDPNTGARIYNDVSPPSAVRRFSWRKPASTVTPALNE